MRKQIYESGQRRYFGGRRNEIVQAYGHKCAFCGMSDDDSFGTWGALLSIHHKDGIGRASKNPNNNIENLQVLCRKCHASLHNKEKTRKMLVIEGVR